jgi:hypothetical protein
MLHDNISQKSALMVPSQRRLRKPHSFLMLLLVVHGKRLDDTMTAAMQGNGGWGTSTLNDF